MIRWFLDRIATHILAFEGDSRVIFFQGNWTEYEADRRETTGRRRSGSPPYQISTVDPVDSSGFRLYGFNQNRGFAALDNGK